MNAARTASTSARPTARGLAAVLVGAADRRMLPALALVPQLAGCEARALHIGTDPVAAHHLAAAWMNLPLDWLPLHIEEPTAPTLAESVRAVIEREAAGRPLPRRSHEIGPGGVEESLDLFKGGVGSGRRRARRRQWTHIRGPVRSRLGLSALVGGHARNPPTRHSKGRRSTS